MAAAGDVSEGLNLLDQAEALTASTGERFLEAERHRLWGDVLTEAGRADEAEASYRAALAVAQSQEARSLALRATLGLCQLATADAGTLLAAVASGFDTPEHRDARRILGTPGEREAQPSVAAAGIPL